MKIEFFQTMTYAGPDHGASWPAAPSACDPAWAGRTYANGLDECSVAVDAGFDTLTFAEHHYSPKQITPNPMMIAALAGERFPGQQIGVFGTDLPITNPVRIAEEYAMFDNLLQGRLRVAMLRGTPNEYLTYFDNPWESRERHEEGTLLVQACWTEPEPFAWEGRYFRYRNIAVWPRVFQNPHPRILVSANSADGAVFAGRNGFDIGFSYMAAEAARRTSLCTAKRLRTPGDPDGGQHPVPPRRLGRRGRRRGVATFGRYAEGGLFALFAGPSYDTVMALGQCGMAMAGMGRGHTDLSGLALREPRPAGVAVGTRPALRRQPRRGRRPDQTDRRNGRRWTCRGARRVRHHRTDPAPRPTGACSNSWAAKWSPPSTPRAGDRMTTTSALGVFTAAPSTQPGST